MTIVQLLQSDIPDVRVSHGSRWLYWDETTREWIVLDRLHGAKKNLVLARTLHEEDAVSALVKDE